MESTEVRQRLLALADERRVSLAKLSAMLGKNPSYLQQFVKKGSPRKLEEGDRARLARFFGVPEEELGKALDKSYNDPDRPITSSGRGAGEWVSIARLDIAASAGPGALAGAEASFDTLRFAAPWLRGRGLDPRALSAIEVTGDSMEPTLRDGDEILVDCTSAPLRDGIHVVRLEDSLLVKRLDTGRPGIISLISDNPLYPPIVCRAEELVVVGRVVWKGGCL